MDDSSGESDEDLWYRAQGGDESAREHVALLVRRYAGGWIGQKRLSWDFAEQIPQSVVLDVLRLLDSGHEVTVFRAFVRYRTRYAFSQYLRDWRSGRNGQVESLEEGGPGVDHERRECAEAVRACIESLSAPLFAVIKLRYYDCMKLKEIAAALGVHKSAVDQRLAKALQGLGRCLTGRGFSVEDAL